MTSHEAPVADQGNCPRCGQQITPCPCGVWWCTGWKHSRNRAVGGSHFCYLGNSDLIAEPPRAAALEGDA